MNLTFALGRQLLSCVLFIHVKKKWREYTAEELDRQGLLTVDSATCFIFPRADSLSELSFISLLISSLLFIPIRHNSVIIWLCVLKWVVHIIKLLQWIIWIEKKWSLWDNLVLVSRCCTLVINALYNKKKKKVLRCPDQWLRASLSCVTHLTSSSKSIDVH